MGMLGYFMLLYVLKNVDICNAGLQFSNWKEAHTWKDNILDNYIVQRVHGISRIQCAGHCDRYPNCESVFYTKSTKFCQLNAVDVLNPGSRSLHVSSSYGTKYYTKSNTIAVTAAVVTPSSLSAAVVTPSSLSAAAITSSSLSAAAVTSSSFSAAAVTSSSWSASTSQVAMPCNGFEYSKVVGRYYTYVRSQVVRNTDADPTCQQVGGRLAQLKTQAAIDAVTSMIQTKAAVTNDDLNDIAFWLAAILDSNRNNFYWIYDNEVIPTNSPLWYINQPQMIKGGANNTQCVVLIPAYGYKLDDFDCVKRDGTKLYPLCECT